MSLTLSVGPPNTVRVKAVKEIISKIILTVGLPFQKLSKFIFIDC